MCIIVTVYCLSYLRFVQFMCIQIFVWGQGNIGAMTFHPEETNIDVQLVDTKGISSR